MNQQLITALYCRLSIEDDNDGDSNSIQNQRLLLSTYANEQKFPNQRFFVDDGYTGTNFNRPAMQELLALVDAGEVGIICVKDLSRFGRDYLTVGNYLERIFPLNDVRFIAINDNVDSAKGDDDFTPIRSYFNDFYAKDTSRKVRAVQRLRGTSGKHLGRAPYGYRDNPDNPGHWLVDEETAPVVKYIFDQIVAGKGSAAIATMLDRQRVLTPLSIIAQRKKQPLPANPYFWQRKSIEGILNRIEYTGCTCNFKTYSKSYKLKKRLPNDPEKIVFIPDTQEAIISQEQWDLVQDLRKQRHRPLQRAERQGLFAGKLECEDCGARMHFTTSKNYDGKQDHYVCANYKSGRGECTAHYIREAVLRDIVLERIRAVTAYVRKDAEGFQLEWMQCRRSQQIKSIQQDKKRLEQAKQRIETLDKLITRVYEDYALGNLPLERYQKMAAAYEKEQEGLRFEIHALESMITAVETQTDNYDHFAALIRKYVEIPELTHTIVNEFVKKIIVSAPDKSSGKRRQRIKIIFNFVGDVNIPILTDATTVDPKYIRKSKGAA